MQFRYSPFRIYIRLLDIENKDNPWPMRIAFVLLTLLNAAAYLNPWIDTDFGPLLAWYDTVGQVTDPSQLTPEMMNAPMTMGNYLALLLPVAAEIITFIAILIYTGHRIRASRLDNIDYYLNEYGEEDEQEEKELKAMGFGIEKPTLLAPPSVSKVVGRILLLLLILAVLALPLAAMMFIFFILIIVALPIVVALPAAFIAGDLKVSEVLPFLIRRAKNVYGFNFRRFAFVLLADLIAGFIVGILSYIDVLEPAFYVLNAAVYTWFAFCYANLGLDTYSIMAGLQFKSTPLNIYDQIMSKKNSKDE
ncbi:MAG: hypothetical protein K5745_06475 [Saccharofermentans sp.]|nr:hypothetical protein [Saccharofermentans sp.]